MTSAEGSEDDKRVVGMCRFFLRNRCRKGASCTHAHSTQQLAGGSPPNGHEKTRGRDGSADISSSPGQLVERIRTFLQARDGKCAPIAVVGGTFQVKTAFVRRYFCVVGPVVYMEAPSGLVSGGRSPSACADAASVAEIAAHLKKQDGKCASIASVGSLFCVKTVFLRRHFRVEDRMVYLDTQASRPPPSSRASQSSAEAREARAAGSGEFETCSTDDARARAPASASTCSGPSRHLSEVDEDHPVIKNTFIHFPESGGLLEATVPGRRCRSAPLGRS